LRRDDRSACIHFQQQLLSWYDANKRDLPWRQNRDPYRVWVSEIMLQQTRVAVVVEYYERFLKRFPSVQKLAAARTESVLAAWSGLGYYRRARALHSTAEEIVRRRDGEFPRSAAAWQELPGIGPYTAAAIASIAFDEPVPAIDGNVERVLSRVFGEDIAGQSAYKVAQSLLAASRPGDFNQAMMELGAIICLPRDPQCLACPVREFCATRGKSPTATKTKREKREVFYSLNRRDSAVLLMRRPETSSLMAGMWELPEISKPRSDTRISATLRHSITVTDFLVRVCDGSGSSFPAGRWVPESRLSRMPLTGLARKILRTAGII
jgi:A/G-specific adenine glycosylase